MAITNFTAEGKQTETFQQLRYSASWASGIHEKLIYLSAFNIFLSITAVLGNTLILVALRKVSSLHPPSKVLFTCLATTDLSVDLITEPLSVVYWIFLTHEEWNLCRYTLASLVIAGYTLCSVSLLTATAISVDRFLALLLGLRYRQVVTLKRTYVIVVIVWVMCAVSFKSPYKHLLRPDTIPLCLVTSIASYTKIFVKLRHHQTQVQGHEQEQPNQINPLNIARYRKAVSSALWVQCTLVACYLPFGIVRACFEYSKTASSSALIFERAATLIFVNSSLNPILYCWKISKKE